MSVFEKIDSLPIWRTGRREVVSNAGLAMVVENIVTRDDPMCVEIKTSLMLECSRLIDEFELRKPGFKEYVERDMRRQIKRFLFDDVNELLNNLRVMCFKYRDCEMLSVIDKFQERINK